MKCELSPSRLHTRRVSQPTLIRDHHDHEQHRLVLPGGYLSLRWSEIITTMNIQTLGQHRLVLPGGYLSLCWSKIITIMNIQTLRQHRLVLPGGYFGLRWSEIITIMNIQTQDQHRLVLPGGYLGLRWSEIITIMNIQTLGQHRLALLADKTNVHDHNPVPEQICKRRVFEKNSTRGMSDTEISR